MSKKKRSLNSGGDDDSLIDNDITTESTKGWLLGSEQAIPPLPSRQVEIDESPPQSAQAELAFSTPIAPLDAVGGSGLSNGGRPAHKAA